MKFGQLIEYNAGNEAKFVITKFNFWCTFQMRFGIGTIHFQKVVPRMKLFLSL